MWPCRSCVTAVAILGLTRAVAAQFSPCEVLKVYDPAPLAGGNLGVSVAMEGDIAFVGAHGRNQGRGTVYVYRRDHARWTLQHPIERSDRNVDDFFGRALDFESGVLVVGAPFANISCPQGDCAQGSASIYELQGTVWMESSRLQPPDLEGFDFFGFSVAVSDGTVFVSARGQNGGVGNVYVFTKEGTVWTAAGKLQIVDSTAGGAIGYDIALDGNIAVVGAPGKSVYGPASGAAYVFEKVRGDWSQVARLIPDDGAAEDNFGSSVAIDGNSIIVGTPLDDDLGSGSGAVYVFERTDVSWAQVTKLRAFDGVGNSVFGWDVAIDDDSMLIGSATKNTLAQRSGSAYLFKNIQGVWTHIDQIFPSDPSVDQVFGVAVTLSQSSLFIGSYTDSSLDIGAGSAYFFLRGEALAGNVDSGDGSFPVDVLALNGSVGDACRNVAVPSNTPTPLFINSAPNGNGHYALWILDGGLAAGGKTFLRKPNGRLFNVGTGARCLPLANTRVPGACPCPVAFRVGMTSASLPQGLASRLCLPSRSALPRAPIFHSVTFPPGEFLLAGVVHDRNSLNSPSLNVSMTNWIVVKSTP